MADDKKGKKGKGPVKPMELPKEEKKGPAATGLGGGGGKKSADLNVLFAKYKGSQKDVSSLLIAAEKRIKEFYEVVTKRVSDFLDNDFKLLKSVSKEELSKINSTLVDYKMQLDKISQEKMKRIAEIKSKMQTRIMTGDEVQSFVKYFDEKMKEVKKLTHNIIDTLRKNKDIVADNFSADLQTVVDDYSKRVNAATQKLFSALKEAAEQLGKPAVADKNKPPKIPSTAELEKIPSKLSSAIKDKEAGSSSSTEDKGRKKGSLMPAALRAKLPNLNLSKHFNSETMYGRANVVKVTYLGAFLYFLYWKFKKPKA